ncbi:MAG TPA: lipid-A-disaccharide synthase [Lentisphaeria bacterium]|nr:lipid-A-disaccharide synthase [Lentisphaerota bacterium]HQC51493.1 lipid-A-disaccharide synthase [Lentisphaeria bacterium]HQL86133.1 lipid-A-disaccharide synthase [Lentisphaeria bacterium]
MSSRQPTIWIMAGEESGDGYGARVATELLRLRPDLRVTGMGGAQMRSAGVELMVDSSELGVVGFVEVLKSLSFFVRLLNRMAATARRERPEAVLLIDYPGFNLRLAKRLHAAGIPVVYYISPQVWAWKKNRIPKIARDVTRLLCIFPFEPAVYEGSGLDVRFVGHPLLEILAPLRQAPATRNPNLILLLPGSRTSEIQRILPIFLDTVLILHRQHPEWRFVMPLPRESCASLARGIIQARPPDSAVDVTITVGDTRQWMRRAAAGLAASGTVTVEATILELPLVVAYKFGWLTSKLARRLIKLPFASITNLVMNRSVFVECLLDDATPAKLAPALLDIMPGGQRRQEVFDGIRECISRLGSTTQASAAVARNLLEVAGLPDS